MRKILVIEDEKVLLHNLVQMLELEGFDATGLSDGASGIASATEDPPNLILCDVAMAGMDGFEVITQLRQNERTAQIPVVFLTAKAERDVMRQGLELGADAYVTKPFTLDHLLDVIYTHLAPPV